MGVEIERKFLVLGDSWRIGAVSEPILQGYLYRGPKMTLRIRMRGEKCFLTIKMPRDASSRHEFEYEIPHEDGTAMLRAAASRPAIEKTRHMVKHDGQLWEVDEFSGANAGLIIAEIELTDAKQSFSRPDWLGPEVTQDGRFYNAALYERPFSQWGISYQDLLSANS